MEIIGYVMVFEAIYVGASIGICWDDLGAIYGFMGSCKTISLGQYCEFTVAVL